MNAKAATMRCGMESRWNVSADYWSQVADKYDRVVDRQIGLGAREQVRARVEQEAPLGALAEFGCGTGFYTSVLARKAERVLATDISPGMLEIARRRVSAANVSFQVEDCQSTSLPSGELDAAFVSLVLHFTEPQRALAEMRPLLKPGGVLIIANLDPRALRGFARVRAMARVVFQGAIGYRVKPPKGFGSNVLTERALCDLLEQTGFRLASADTIADPAQPS